MTSRSIGVLAAFAVAVSVGGCGSSSKSAATTQPTEATSATVTEASTSPPPATSGAAGATTPATTAPAGATTPSAAGDVAAIKAAFTTFFDGLDPDTNAKIAVLEHGDVLGSMVVDAAQNPQFQQLSTVVNSVDMLSDADCTAAGEVTPCALVGHDLFVGGLPAMVGLKSHAVRIDGTWKVSASSWCAVVTIGGATCPQLPTG